MILQITPRGMADHFLQLRPATVEDCFYSPHGNLEVMRIRNKQFDPVEYVTQALVHFNLSFNFQNVMNVAQCKSCATDVVNKYWTYSPEDFKLFFQRAKELRYLKNFYNTIDETKILVLLEMHDAWREKEIVRIRKNEQLVAESNMQTAFTGKLISIASDPEAPGDILQKLKELSTKLLQSKRAFYSKPVDDQEPGKPEPTEFEITCQELLKEFDTIMAEQFKGETLPAIAYIDYEGKKMGYIQYCNTRLPDVLHAKKLAKIRTVMPNVYPNCRFKTGGRLFICDGIGWNGTEDCIFYHEIDINGNALSEQRDRGTAEVKKLIKEEKITFP